MKIEDARAIIETQKAEVALERKCPRLSMIVERMKRQGYPMTAAMVVGFATIMDESDLELQATMLEKDWR